MGLSQATMNAIARAQKATATSTASVGANAFADSYEKAYSEQVEKLAKEEEKLEKAKLNSLDELEELTLLGTKLGKFGPEGEKILKAAKDEVYKTYDLKSTFDQTVAQREIMARVKKELEPFGETNLYLQSAIKANSTKSLDKSMIEIKNFAGSKYNKYQVVQALGEKHEVVDKETIRTYIDGNEINIKIADFKNQEFAISNNDLQLQEQFLKDENTFVRDARQSNMTNNQVENMVDEYMRNIDQQGKKNLLYNFFNIDLSEEAANYEGPEDIYKTTLKERMLKRIRSRYNEEDEKKNEDEPKSYVTRANELIEAGKTAAGTKQLLSDRLRGQYQVKGDKVTFLSGYEKDGNGDEDFSKPLFESTPLNIYNLNDRKQILSKVSQNVYIGNEADSISDIIFKTNFDIDSNPNTPVPPPGTTPFPPIFPPNN
tara:strand:- start:683 stop:1972 length:1290 start_codon:yes stop_codon:yes gene_type:complete